MRGDQSSLALHRSLRLDAGTREGGGQAPRRLVFMNVAWFELDEVYLAGLPDSLEVPAAEHRSLAQVRAKVVNQHAAVDVTPLGRSSIQSNRLHLLRG
jgi:hypothetical protein